MRLYPTETTQLIISTDESGRGCLALPVVAAATIIDPEASPIIHPLLNDSKRMSARNRVVVKEFVEENLLTAVGIVDAHEIDKINILKASHKAMHIAIQQLCEILTPDLIVVDGDRFSPFYRSSNSGDKIQIPHVCIPRGDSIYAGVAYSSVVAKETRDELVKNMCDAHPYLSRIYEIDKNKGYPSPAHLKALKTYGVSKFHRKSYAPCVNLPMFHYDGVMPPGAGPSNANPRICQDYD